MITNNKPVLKDKHYCGHCNIVFSVHSSECEVCGYHDPKVFKVDDRYSDLIQFNALRSMRRYNIKMGNI